MRGSVGRRDGNAPSLGAAIHSQATRACWNQVLSSSNHPTITIAACQIENASRYGTVQVDKTNRVIGFTEKTGTQAPGLVNGGVYVFNRSILQYIADGPASLERDVFPSLLEHGVYALEQRGMFIDIGTPEDYLRAQELNHRLYQAAVSKSSS